MRGLMISEFVAVTALVGAAVCHASTPAPDAGGGRGMSSEMVLVSSAFASGGPIPQRHTCDGADLSPPLSWSNVPASARSLVLIVDDPDAPDPAAPKMDWVHWIVYDLPPSTTGLDEGVSFLPPGSRQGTNDFVRTTWGGPCPPVGRHRYFFRLYALDVMLPDLGFVRRPALLSAMEGHILAQAELVGTYMRVGAAGKR